MKTNNAFCSICTVSHSAYAATLNDSLKKAGHSEPHYVLIVDYDQKYKDIIDGFKFTPVFLSELNIPRIDELIRKYSAFELCNVLRPFFMEWLLKNNPTMTSLIFLDTDIYVYSPLTGVFDRIRKDPNTSVILTPHLSDYDAYATARDYRLEKAFFAHGLYNSGFYVLKNDGNSLRFLEWLKDKLFDHCYNAPYMHMFVDQKILDLAPVLFDFVNIYKDRAYNVAHWNYSQGLIEEDSGMYRVGKNRLVFFHFSQLRTDPSDMTGNFYLDISPEDRRIFEKMASGYLACLKRNNHDEIRKIPYGYERAYVPPELSSIDPLLSKSAELASVKAALDSAEGMLVYKTTELNDAYHSRGWRFVVYVRKVLNVIIPRGSAQRRVTASIYEYSKKGAKFYIGTKQRLSGSLSELKSGFVSFKPRAKRRINKQSKKIVFIGHYYHDKTKSSAFLIDYLRQHYEVKVILDESYIGKEFPDLSFVDRSYLAVVFFQSLPSRKIIDKIDNDNIIHFPMYDAAVGRGRGYWNEYRSLKMINFSSTLHKDFVKWRFESVYTQYFPEPEAFSPGNVGEAFFWQRLDSININTVACLLKGEEIKVHVHRTVDPWHKFIQPSKVLEDTFHIGYSDWFKTKEEMLDIVRSKGIYIAPREYEGIGMSFLEAMAMGKAVIAVNHPTMNEYIEDKKTGYLFDLKNPREICFGNIEEVQRNAHEYMKIGYQKWMAERRRIIDFIVAGEDLIDPVVDRKVGRKTLKMQASHQLPLYYKKDPLYDRALPRIAKMLSGIDGHLTCIDVGANIGDTVSLITDEVKGSFLCVEGDREFLPFLKDNTRGLDGNVIVIEDCYCAEDGEKDRKVKVHRKNGTAWLEYENKAGESGGVTFKKLDDIVEKYPLFKGVNLLKIDTDGFDFDVLRGGRVLLKEATPLLYFEFDPESYSRHIDHPLSVFDLLYQSGYQDALVYDNFGVPLKIIKTSDTAEIKRLMGSIDKRNIYYFDILTLHHSKKDKYGKIIENELLEKR